MENRTNTAVIEISDTSVKFAVGYCINEKPVVVYTKVEKLPEGAVINGRIINDALVKETVSKFLNIDDESVRRKVNDITTIVIPPLGFKNYITDKSTLGSDQNGIICPQDLLNIIHQAHKLRIPDGSALVGVIPSKFVVDDKPVTKEYLYGYKGKELKARLYLHTVLEDVLNEQKITVQQAGFRTDTACVSSYCATSLIGEEPDCPPYYFYADFGARLTTVTVVDDKKSPYVSSTFASNGGDDLTTYIANRLLLDQKEAEMLKMKYGYCVKPYAFQLPIWEGCNLNGEKVKISQNDLNAVIKDFFAELNQFMSNAIRTICETSKAIKQREFPLYCGGGATKLRGFKELISPLRNMVGDIKLYVPKVPGARDPSMINLLGLIAINGDSKEHTDGSFRGMSTLVRQ